MDLSIGTAGSKAQTLSATRIQAAMGSSRSAHNPNEPPSNDVKHWALDQLPPGATTTDTSPDGG